MSTATKAYIGIPSLLIIIILITLLCRHYKHEDLQKVIPLKEGQHRTILLNKKDWRLSWKHVGYNFTPSPNARCIMEYKGKEYPFDATGWEDGHKPPFPPIESDQTISCILRSDTSEEVRVILTVEKIFKN
jgi:hypothetical protein